MAQEKEPYKYQEYPRALYRGEPKLDAAHNAGAEESIIVHSNEEKEAAIKKGFRLSPEQSAKGSKS